MRRLGPLSILVCLVLTSGCGFGDRSDILILTRADDPSSRAIAEEYAKARDVPLERILELALSGPSDAVEIEAEEYLREIAEPVERFLEIDDPDGEIALLVTTRGLPLRIGSCDPHSPGYPLDCRSAAVDAALAQLGRTGDPRLGFRRIENPFFRAPESFERFRRDSPKAALRFLVARLTEPMTTASPSESTSEALADPLDPPANDSSDPEADPAVAFTAPLWRVVSESPRGSRTAAASALIDPIEERLPLLGQRVCDGCTRATPGSDANGIVLQSGERGPTSEPPTERLSHPGLVIRLDGVSIERASGADSASAFERFTSRWRARGARAISTHLADPSLPDVTRPTAQLAALARGATAVEAHFKSVPQLGWMNVFVGDPLLALPEEALILERSDDQDRDGVADSKDNCRDDPNPEQRDTNADGLGNACDPDVDDDGRVDTSRGAIYPVDRRGDLEAISLTARNGPYDPNHDLDGDGRVDERDVVRAQLWLFRTPGQPSRAPVVGEETDASAPPP